MPDAGQYSLGLRVANAFASLASYLQFTVWPTGLAVFYPYYGVIENTQISAARVVIGVVLMLGGIAVGIAVWRRERAVMIGWLWFLGTLVPVIGLVQVGRQSMADRYTYIPHIGLFIAMVWGLAACMRAWKPVATRASAIVAAITAIIAIALSARTYDQLRHWRDSGTLFSHVMRVTDPNPVAHSNLATYLIERGDTAAALQLLLQAIDIVPREAGPYYHAGRLFAARGEHDQAVRYFQESIEREPGSFVAHYDLAVELAEHGDVKQALPHFEEAIRINPEQPEAHYAYSLALRQAGENQRAELAYQRYSELARRRGVTPLPIPTTNPDNRPTPTK
jgi:protein O-mannosyl-transferase